MKNREDVVVSNLALPNSCCNIRLEEGGTADVITNRCEQRTKTVERAVTTPQSLCELGCLNGHRKWLLADRKRESEAGCGSFDERLQRRQTTASERIEFGLTSKHLDSVHYTSCPSEERVLCNC